MFSEHKPFYFVLNNEGENYYLDSCLSLNSDNYFWYQLKKDGMKSVYFVEKTADNSVQITIKDNDSFQNNTYKRGILTKKLWNPQNENPRSEFTVPTSADAAARWMLARIQEPDTSIITDADTLKCMFQNAEDQEQLIEKASEGKGTLIIKYPVNPDQKQLELLVGPDSIFRKEINGKCLFKPLYALLISGDPSAAIFDELKKSVPGQSLETGYIDFESLKMLMKNVGYALDLHFSENEFLDHVNYLFYWLENAQVRRDSGGLFGNINGIITRKKLFDVLTSGQMGALKEREQMLHRIYQSKHPDESGQVPLSRILFEQYGPKNTVGTLSHVYISNPALEKLCSTEFPMSHAKSSNEFDIVTVSDKEWNIMRSSIEKPRNSCFDQKKTDWIQAFLSYIEPAKMCGDGNTLKRAVNMLMYCGNNLYTVPTEEFESYCKNGRDYLNYSKTYFTLKQKVMKYMNGSETGKISQTTLLEAEKKANEVKFASYLKVLQDLDQYFVQTQTKAIAISNWNFDNEISFHDPAEDQMNAQQENSSFEKQPINFEQPINFAQSMDSVQTIDPVQIMNHVQRLNPEKQRIDEEVAQMSEGERLEFLRNELD